MSKKRLPFLPFKDTDLLSRVASISTGIFLFFWLLGIGLLVWRVVPLVYGQESVPLHYNVHVGIDMTGPWWQVFLIPACGLVWAILNGLVAQGIRRRAPALAITLWVTTAAIAPLLFLACASVVLVNIAYG